MDTHTHARTHTHTHARAHAHTHTHIHHFTANLTGCILFWYVDAYIRTVEKSTPKGAGRNFLDGDRTPSKKQAQETHKQLQIPARGTPRRGRINPRQFRDDSESPLSGGNKNTSDVDGGTKQTAGKRAKQSSMRIGRLAYEYSLRSLV